MANRKKKRQTERILEPLVKPGKPTLANGRLPLKSFPDNSRQAFKPSVLPSSR
jgi:hypothetical protein